MNLLLCRLSIPCLLRNTLTCIHPPFRHCATAFTGAAGQGSLGLMDALCTAAGPFTPGRAEKLNDEREEMEGRERTQQNEGSVSGSPYLVQIADRYGMPAELPPGASQSFEELEALCPSDTLREQLQQLRASRRWKTLTEVQRATIPLVLDHRDILCVAPTATGKTFCYVFPSMLRLVLHAGGREKTTADGGSDELNRSNVETLLKDKIARGEVCRYCELGVAYAKVCPMTGTPHPPMPDLPDKQLRPAMRLSELTSVAEPLLLILVPTSQLVTQVYQLYTQLHADFRVRFLVRASSAEEQKRHLKALESCDVLITTPETMLPALYKRKLTLKRVKMLVMDEVDELVSVNHFEKVKIILGALPKAHERPQRIFLEPPCLQ
ncbi:putative ATP-dependent DEAD/H RNA helicase, putative,RNA helicase [Trypanosoma rangeli]|uniref:ATP-dependent RNA helicase n=1 Tax=Trypanosoma rangeli TaxID=5698 RepID=A0A3R7MIJ4_TRYRA|nr:putative ATP-dependent DEAD/H RNA helicase, putative,RNA helicase [Trypanosoma rangeli]RNF03143.1 putative ATP-dependent DEAD/H RNA helicase, putative,RNA helicase [Trypanosoma rangeli]|eukprot:RNF03143.1 putative ATP-dependent DEAD/H RNA helicase, putative,RNA helicase [Trypanosoma rangeli]